MMHVAVDGRMLAYRSAGISQYIRHLVNQLGPLMGPNKLTLLHSARHTKPQLSASSVRLTGVLTPPHNRLEQVSLPLELLRVRPRVIHSPDFIPPFTGPWRRVITIHDLGFLLYPETVTRESHEYYGQVRRAVKVADAIIAVSQHTGRDIAELLDADPARIHVIPNGVDPAMAPLNDSSAIGQWRTAHGIDRRYILYAGTFEPRKNLPLLVDAFARLHREHDVQLVLLGARGWLYQSTFDRIRELGISEHVRVLEGLPRSEYATAYSGASVAVTPSIYEGFGLPVLEAMACGAPVVSSDAASLPEVVGDAGLLFHSGDADSLAEAINRVLSDNALDERLRSAGFAQARKFSWSVAAAQTLEVYKRVAA